jgi:hypothetical protein
MDDHDARVKRAPKELWLSRNCADNKYEPLAQERQILEMIALDAPLPSTLNRLCSIVDVEIGDVVSVISLAEEESSRSFAKARSAMKVGLTLFSSTDVFSRSKTLLGTLEIYGCDSRLPTAHENELIKRVARLAAIALQRHKDAQELERSGRNPGSAPDIDEAETPRYIN